MALRASANSVDVHLERKLRYKDTKLKTGEGTNNASTIEQHMSALATPEAQINVEMQT